MKKPKTDEEYKVVREIRDSHLDVILVAYDRPIKYDYILPDPYRIGKQVYDIIYKISAPKTLKETIIENVYSGKDEHSILENYMRLSDYIFGHEWFYGYGTLYRWREGKKEQAEKNIKKYISSIDMKYYKIIQDAIRIKEDIKEFRMDEAMRTL